jgi:hypothetical protein
MDEFTLPLFNLCSVRALIQTHRRLGRPKNGFVRQVGTVLATSALEKRLTGLSDRQIGQLMADEVGQGFPLFQPETVIWQQAIHRLFRSSNGAFSSEEIASQQRHPPCPRCGNDMLLHYGIEAPDFYECTFLSCGYKQFVEGNVGGDSK